MQAEAAVVESPPLTTEPAAPPPPTVRTLNVEAVVWAVVLAVAAMWRLLGLGSALPATAEAVRARLAWEFARGSIAPGWPGDLASALAALVIRTGGDHIGWVRAGPALFGLGCVAALALLRPYAGRATALLAALLLATSPIAVAASRTLSPDTAGLLCGLLIAGLSLRISEDGDGRVLPLLGATAGIALTTGAVAVALMIITAAWIAVEVAWLDRSEVAARWRQAVTDRGLLRSAVLLALPGIALGLVRFGAGPDRLSLAALSDWSGPIPDSAISLPWHVALTALLAYEPLALLVGGAGAAFIARRWRREGAGAVTPFDRLLLVWAAGGLFFTITALHHRPGQLLLLALPLMLLAARATVQALPSLASFRVRESGLLLLPVALVLGWLALQMVSWANAGGVPRNGALGAIVLVAISAGLVFWAVDLSPRAAPGVLVAGAWLLLGWLGPHGAAAVAHRNGDEPLTGQRPVQQRAALVRGIDYVLDSGYHLAIDRRLAAAMAWELRGREVQLYTGLPPQSDLVVRVVEQPRAPVADYVPSGVSAPVEERWYPSGWNTVGFIRWLVFRDRWGPSRTLTGEMLTRAQ